MIVHGENVPELFKAFAKAQGAFNAPKKDKKGHNYNYADLAAVIEATSAAMSSNGLSIIQGASTDVDGSGRQVVTVETMILHDSGTYLQFPPLSLNPVKTDPQGIGSALTYARRYAYMAAVGIAPEDDDGAAGSGVPQQSAQRKQAAPAKVASKPAAKAPQTNGRKTEEPGPSAAYNEMRGKAIAWGNDQGVFNALEHAQASFEKLEKENPEATTDEMRKLWKAKIDAKIDAMVEEAEEVPA